MQQVRDLKPLTSLRFVAAGMICLLHAIAYFPWAKLPIIGNFPLSQGVSFFFVLSGFILTHVYTVKKLSVGSFMLSRFARLWPVHLATCILVITFIRVDARQPPGTGFFDPWLVLVSNLSLTHSMVPFANYVFSWNSVSWSISTEMFFYLLFPFLLLHLRKFWWLQILVGICLILAYIPVVYWFDIPRTTANMQELSVTFLLYSSFVFRLFEFSLGMCSYLLWKKIGGWKFANDKLGVIELAALLVFVVFAAFVYDQMVAAANPSKVLSMWVSSAVYCFAFALLIIAFANGAGVVGQVLSWRPFVWLGEISFALYMVHQPIMRWLILHHMEGKMGMPGPVLVFGACLVGAALLHHLVELPARALILRWMASRPASRSALPAGTV
jgi:peptidoglycan/LPS O-acetylase OafA/YrhL